MIIYRGRRNASAVASTTRRHDTLNNDQRQVQYPWHPLYGQTLIVYRELTRLRVASAYCRLPGEEARRVPAIPQWMFDRAVCSLMRLEPQPRVCWQALADVRELLNAAAAITPPSMIQDGHHLSKGDAHVQTPSSVPTPKSAGLVQPTAEASRLAVPARPDPTTGPALAGQDASVDVHGLGSPSGTDGGGR